VSKATAQSTVASSTVKPRSGVEFEWCEQGGLCVPREIRMGRSEARRAYRRDAQECFLERRDNGWLRGEGDLSSAPAEG
jgi:hypothetical protein